MIKKFHLCPVCHGSGKVLTGAFRGQVVEPDLAADPEFMEQYLNGTYDVDCEACHGKRVMDRKKLADWKADEKYRQEMLQERRMGY
jgi:mono/diheme cytochrome c family protein